MAGSNSPAWLVWRWLAPTGWPVASAISSPSSIAAPAATTRSSFRCSSITRWPCAAPSETFDGPARREPRTRVARVEHDLDLIRSARAARDETMRRAGLEEDLSSARIYLGEMPANLISPAGWRARTERAGSHPLVRPACRTHRCHAGNRRDVVEVSLTLEERPWDAIGNASRAPIRRHDSSPRDSLAGHGVHWAARTWPSSLALVTALGLAGYTGGPLILAGAMGLAVAGWRMDADNAAESQLETRKGTCSHEPQCLADVHSRERPLTRRAL